MPTTIQRKQYAYQICERHKAMKGNIHYTTEVDDGPDIVWKLIQWKFRERNVKTDLFSGKKKIFAGARYRKSDLSATGTKDS